MLLNDYLNKLKKTSLKELNKPWINGDLLNKSLIDNIFPDEKTEEWKNFNLNPFLEKKWKLSKSENNANLINKDLSHENLLVFNNGVLNKELTKINEKEKVKIYNLKDYYNNKKNNINKIYSSNQKYAEERISGVIDDKVTNLLSLNTLLNNGIVIEISKDSKVNNEICLYNQILADEAIINPYILIIANENAEVSFLDLTSYIKDNSWTNIFYEIYLEKNSKAKISNLSLNQSMNLNTSSYNFHLEQDATLEFSSINKGNSKKDIRVFLNGENSKADIKGMLLSKQSENNDIFCKVIHNSMKSISNQDWRMISADNSKTSLNGKIKILKGSKDSSGTFFSKSILLNKKAKAFSKPELEIFEDQVSCSHGSSFGEIELDKIFYLQSRGVPKEEAIRVLILAFISELDFRNETISENIINEIKQVFLEEKNDNRR